MKQGGQNYISKEEKEQQKNTQLVIEHQFSNLTTSNWINLNDVIAWW